MELYELVRTILKNKRMILLLSLSAVVQTVLITYAITEKYSATALVLIRPHQTAQISATATPKELLDFPIPTTVPFEAMLQTYGEVLKSRVIVEKVVQILHLDVKQPEKKWWKRLKNTINDYLSDAWTLLKYGRVEEESAFNEAVNAVTSSLSVTPTKDTYIFEIKCEFKDPRISAAVVNTAAAELVQYYGELNRADAKKTRQSVEERLRENQDVLTQTRTELRRFKEGNQISSLDIQVKSKIDTLSEFERALESTRRDVQGATAEIRAIKEQIGEQDRYLKSSSKVADNPLVTDLNSELAKLEIDLSGWLKKFGPSHPEVLALQAKITETKKKLAEQEVRKVTEETSSLNSVHQNLLNDLVHAETRLQGSRAKEANLDATISMLKAELSDLPRKQGQLGKLELDLGVTEDTHKQLTTQYEDARSREVDIVDTHLVSEALVPTYPAKPIKIYYAGAALLQGLVFGIAFALFCEWLSTNRRQAQQTT